MAGLLSRFTTFVPNATILSNDHNQELNRIVQLLNGTTTNLKTVLKTSDTGDPPLELDQLSTGPILEGYQGGILKFSFSNAGDLIANGITGAAGVYTFGSIPVLPASNPTTANQAARKSYVDGKLVILKECWNHVTPNAAEDTGDFTKTFVVPSGTGMRATKFSIIRSSGTHNGGSSIRYRLLRNEVGLGSGVSFNDTNSAANTEYSEALNQALSAGDRLTVLFDSVVGSISETRITMMMEWEQSLT